jgi:hypothetical protein
MPRCRSWAGSPGGNTVNLENVVKLAPDLVLDIGNTTATYVSLADRVQEQTSIPSVLIGDRLADTAETLRTLGGLPEVQERTEALAGYAASRHCARSIRSTSQSCRWWRTAHTAFACRVSTRRPANGFPGGRERFIHGMGASVSGQIGFTNGPRGDIRADRTP